MIGKKKETFYIVFAENHFSRKDIISSGDVKMKVLETPHRKWWKVLFKYLTFGLYQPPYQYKVKIINE